jgi:hypothetical protein
MTDGLVLPSGVGHNNLKLFIVWLWYGAALGASFILFFGFRIYDIYLHVRGDSLTRTTITRQLDDVVVMVDSPFPCACSEQITKPTTSRSLAV